MKIQSKDLDTLTLEDWRRFTDAAGPSQAKAVIRSPAPGVRLRAMYTLDDFEGGQARARMYPVVRHGTWSIVARIPSPEYELSWMRLNDETEGAVTGVIVDADHSAGAWNVELADYGMDRFVDCYRGRKDAATDGEDAGPIRLDDPLLRAASAGRNAEISGSGDLTIDGRHVADAPPNSVHTLACMTAACAEHLSSDSASRRIRALVPSYGELLLSVATIRAVRILLTHVMGAFELTDEHLELWGIVGGCHGSRDRASHQIRLTLGCTAAVLGSCDRIVAEPYAADDEPDVDSLRLALSTPRILRYESLLGAVEDPMRGSYYVETLTGEIIDAAWKVFLEIEDRGGLSSAASAGALRDLTQATAGGPQW